MSEKQVTNYRQMPQVPRQTYVAKLDKPEHVDQDWVEPAQYNYNAEDHRVWDVLFNRQMELLEGRACNEFLAGLKKLDLGRGGVPKLAQINEELSALTGWVIVPVPMLIPDHVFFYHLANKRFPAGNFIRKKDQLDYIQEPDAFHDIFGHVPMLADPIFAKYMEAYGKAGWKALKYNRLRALGALYWYTVEFGLIQTEAGLRIYGAGIVSSPVETIYALEGKSPHRLHLNVDRVMRTDYCISDLQSSYFVIDSFDQLYRHTVERKFDQIYEGLQPAFQYAPTSILDIDHVINRGTQEYYLRGGRGSAACPI